MDPPHSPNMSLDPQSRPAGPPVGLKSPFNFSPLRKIHIVIAGLYFVFNSSLASSLPSGTQDELARYFRISSDDVKLVLPASLYMAGFALGPLIFGPASEYFGRKPTLISTYAMYLLFTMACALAPSFPALLVFRFFCGFGASTPNAVLGGLYSDIYDDPHQRGTVMSVFIFANTIPPLLGPLISGFLSQASWRWVFWAALLIGVVGFPLILTIPETYMPVLIQRHEAAICEKRDRGSISQRFRRGLREFSGKLVPVLTRPFIMIIQEPIVLCCSLYLALIYAVLYLYFQAYPIVFRDLYGMSAGVSGLAFLPIIPGSIIAFIVFLIYSSYHTKALRNNLAWAKVEEYRRLPLACFAAPFIPIALFWLGWSAKPSIPPAMPMMSGIFFGIGYVLIFIALLNYLIDAYKQFSASAAAAASTTRSILAVCLPLATTPMYTKLGIDWASSLLGFVSILMAIIPFVFIRYGEWIRLRSPFAQKAARGEMLYKVDVSSD